MKVDIINYNRAPICSIVSNFAPLTVFISLFKHFALPGIELLSIGFVAEGCTPYAICAPRMRRTLFGQSMFKVVMHLCACAILLLVCLCAIRLMVPLSMIRSADKDDWTMLDVVRHLRGSRFGTFANFYSVSCQ